VSIIFLESRRLSKDVRVPNGPADYAELRKHHQIIDDATLSTADAFDNLLGYNQFAEDWGSYFFYFRCGRMLLTPSDGYYFINWPTSDIVTAFNQAKKIVVTEHCFEEEAVLFGAFLIVSRSIQKHFDFQKQIDPIFFCKMIKMMIL
jgi:hypothetical protein